MYVGEWEKGKTLKSSHFFLNENIHKFYEIKKKKIITFRFFFPVVLLVLRSTNCTGEEKSKTEQTQNTYLLDFKKSLSMWYVIAKYIGRKITQEKRNASILLF